MAERKPTSLNPLNFGEIKTLAGETADVQIGSDITLTTTMALTRREFNNASGGSIMFYLKHTPTGGTAEYTYVLVPTVLAQDTKLGTIESPLDVFQPGILQVWVKYDATHLIIPTDIVSCNLKLDPIG